MADFKVGDRVIIYGYQYYRPLKGCVIETGNYLDDDHHPVVHAYLDKKIGKIDEILSNVWVSPKQCRKLVKKKKNSDAIKLFESLKESKTYSPQFMIDALHKKAMEGHQENKKEFDPTKPVQTRDGRKARIICTDSKFCKPIVALIESKSYGGEEILLYYENGKHLHPEIEPAEKAIDLINIPEPNPKCDKCNREY